jgi:hypothetical protein
MKPVFFITILALAIWACSPVKNASKTAAVVSKNSQDSTEYELMIIDIHFDQWYQLNYSEAKDRTEDYYHNKNMVAVYTWNDLYRRGKYMEVIDSYIDYQPQIDYGIEVNRKLFWYFKFVEDYYGIRLFY